MATVNYLSKGEGTLGVNYALQSLDTTVVSGEESYVNRVRNMLITPDDFSLLKDIVNPAILSFPCQV